MRGQWPSGWEDPEDEELDAAEPDEETSVRLAEVAAFLVAVPDPVLPGAIEARIVAALAVESAARAEKPAVSSPEPGAPRILRPRPTRPRVRHPGRPRRFERVRPAMVAGPLVACLLFAGLGYAISRAPSSSSSSGPSAAAPASTAQNAPGSASGYSSEAGAHRASTSGIVVTRSGTNYLAGTLSAQVHTTFRMDVAGKTPHPAASSSSAAGSSVTSAAASASAVPSPRSVAAAALRGCVLHLTGEVVPRLVDQARYEGTPAYVIATASHVWVVGLDCTKASPDVIAQASLAS